MLPLALLVATLPAQASLRDLTPSGVHLLDEGLLAQTAPPLEPLPPLEAPPTPAQLKAEYDALKRTRVSLGAPITLMALGGAASVLGITYLVISTSVGLFVGTVSPFLVLGLALLVVGVPLAVIGTWLLFNRIGDRRRIDAELKELEQQLRELEAAPQPPAPPPLQVLGPRPGVLLARF